MLEHRVRITNLITRAGWEARLAIDGGDGERAAIREILDDTLSDFPPS